MISASQKLFILAPLLFVEFYTNRFVFPILWRHFLSKAADTGEFLRF